jgi:hypothetical protein
MSVADGVLAASVQVQGVHGVLLVLGALLFLVAAIIAWFVAPRTHWATFVAAGLCLLTLSFLVTR